MVFDHAPFTYYMATERNPPTIGSSKRPHQNLKGQTTTDFFDINPGWRFLRLGALPWAETILPSGTKERGEGGIVLGAATVRNFFRAVRVCS